MKKLTCERLHLEHLHNEECFKYLTDVKTYTEQYGAKEMDIEAYFQQFLPLYTQLDLALEQMRKSAYTDKIAEADKKRDHTFQGMAEVIKSAHKHFDNDKKEAARVLQIVIDHYKKLMKKGYMEQTGVIINLLQDLKGKHATQAQSLELAQWIAHLETNNNDFDALMQARFEEEREKPSLKTAELRTTLTQVYREMLEQLDALVKVNGEDKYKDYIGELNVRTHYYQHILAQRKGKHKEDDTTKAAKTPSTPKK
ncbi:MAG: DUF6261 family protein [Bacteroidales bacterium]